MWKVSDAKKIQNFIDMVLGPQKSGNVLVKQTINIHFRIRYFSYSYFSRVSLSLLYRDNETTINGNKKEKASNYKSALLEQGKKHFASKPKTRTHISPYEGKMENSFSPTQDRIQF